MQTSWRIQAELKEWHQQRSWGENDVGPGAQQTRRGVHLRQVGLQAMAEGRLIWARKSLQGFKQELEAVRGQGLACRAGSRGLESGWGISEGLVRRQTVPVM